MSMVVTPEHTDTIEMGVVGFGAGDAAVLVAEADAAHTELYGHPDATPLWSEDFDPVHRGVFLVAYRAGEPVGCGGYRQHTNDPSGTTAEVKRVYVREAARRGGLATALLTQLEDHARRAGYTRLILDVGRRQQPAVALYEASGYHRIPGFSIYRDRPNNRAYAKDLPPRSGGEHEPFVE